MKALSFFALASFVLAPASVLAEDTAVGPGAPGGAPSSGCTVRVAIDKIGDPIVTRDKDTLHVIAVHNTGTCKLKKLHLVDQLSPSMNFKHATGSPYYTPSGWGGMVKWKGEYLAPGQSAIVAVKVEIAKEAPRFIYNRACLTVGSAVTPRPMVADAESEINAMNWTFCDTFTSATTDRQPISREGGEGHGFDQPSLVE